MAAVQDEPIGASNNLDTAAKYMAVGSVLPVTEERMKALIAAARIYKQLDMKAELAKCYELIGEKFLERKEYENAMIYSMLAGDSIKEGPCDRKFLQFYDKAAEIYIESHRGVVNREAKLEWFEEQAKGYESTKKWKKLANLCDYAMDVLYQSGHHYGYSLKIAKYYERAGDRLGVARSYRIAGQVAPKLQEGIDFINKAKTIFSGLMRYSDVAHCYARIGDKYAREGNYGAAALNYEQSGHLCEEKCSMGFVFEYYEKAESNYRLARNINGVEKVQEAIKRCQFKNTLSKLYIVKGSTDVIKFVIDPENIIGSIVDEILPTVRKVRSLICFREVSVVYRNEDGSETESAEDFFIRLSNAIIENGYFVKSNNGESYVPNPEKTDDGDADVFEAFGVVLFLAVFMRQTIHFPIARFILGWLLGGNVNWAEDLQDYDTDLFKKMRLFMHDLILNDNDATRREMSTVFSGLSNVYQKQVGSMLWGFRLVYNRRNYGPIETADVFKRLLLGHELISRVKRAKRA